MATVELTQANFDSVATGGGPVLVDFLAAWCGPCRKFGPVSRRVSERHADAVLGKARTEAQQALAGAFGISSILTLMVIRDGIVLYAQPGTLPEPTLEQWITSPRCGNSTWTKSGPLSPSAAAPPRPLARNPANPGRVMAPGRGLR